LEKGFESACVSIIVDKLQDEDLQSDYRFSEGYIRYRGRRGFGPKRISIDLEKRGVSSAVISKAFALAEVDFYETAASAFSKKFSAKAISLAEKARQQRFMEYRGFYSEHVKYALGNGIEDENI
jgi:regulatory protein